MEPSYKLTYYPWIAQNKTKEEIKTQVGNFAAEVEKELRKASARVQKIEVLPAIEVPAQIAAIAEGTCDIALMNPLGYIFARDEARKHDKEVAAIAVALRSIRGQPPGKFYFAQIYTNKKTGITKDDLSKMKGRSIGFGVSYSTSNFLVPAHELKKMGLHPLSSFSRVEYFGGHDTVAKAVYEGRVDLGAGHDGVIADLAGQYGFGDARDRLATLVEVNIPSDPIAVSLKEGDERNKLRDALVAAGKTKEGQKALAEFWGKVAGLASTDASAYDELWASVKELSLSAADLIKTS